ncbi:hypothetical protein BS78_05G149700 [Paspalum vaginatum]|nr:hypothetical protein BS78_05G149700 [Paspalum vaginatum]
MPTRTISSVRQLRECVDKDKKASFLFRIDDQTSLAESRRLWKAVSTTNGHGRLDNLHVIDGKDEALRLLRRKVEQLRGWVAHADEKLEEIDAALAAVDASLGTGVMALPASYQPMTLDGPEAFLDTDLDEPGVDEVEDHIAEIRSLYSEVAAEIPRRGYYWSEEAFKEREVKDQKGMLGLNSHFLEVKKAALEAMKGPRHPRSGRPRGICYSHGMR